MLVYPWNILLPLMQNSSYISASFYDDTGTSLKIGSSCSIECDTEAFRIIKLNWGAPEDYERNRDGEVELSWTVQGEALTRLMKTCNNAKTPKDVVNYLYQRFSPHNRVAHYELLEWLDKKEIKYYFSEY